MEKEKALHEIIKDQLQAKAITPEKLRQQTGVADRYLAAIVNGEFEKLPAAPYVRGYLMRIAAVLELDGNDLWERFRREGKLKSSGPEDRMPENRFALRRVNKKFVAFAVFAVLLGSYLVFGVNRFLGRPALTVTAPEPETIVSSASVITIAGEIDPGDILKIDGEEVTADREGRFTKEYFLEPGLNSITISAENPFGGRRTETIRQVIYEPEGKNPFQ